jgi:hypothetical protein
MASAFSALLLLPARVLLGVGDAQEIRRLVHQPGAARVFAAGQLRQPVLEPVEPGDDAVLAVAGRAEARDQAGEVLALVADAVLERAQAPLQLCQVLALALRRLAATAEPLGGGGHQGDDHDERNEPRDAAAAIRSGGVVARSAHGGRPVWLRRRRHSATALPRRRHAAAAALRPG